MRRLVLVLVLLFAVTQWEDAEARRGRRGRPAVRRGAVRRSLPRRVVGGRRLVARAPIAQAAPQNGGLNLQLDPNGIIGIDGNGLHGAGTGLPLVDATGRPIDPSFFPQDPGSGNLSTGISPESEFRIAFGNESRCVANLADRVGGACTAIIPAACAPRSPFGGFFSTDIMGSRQVLGFDAIGNQFVEVRFACFPNERFRIPSERTSTFRRIAGDPRGPGFFGAATTETN